MKFKRKANIGTEIKYPFEAFKHYLEMPDKIFYRMLYSKARTIESTILNYYWTYKTEFSQEEKIYKAWCNGLSVQKILAAFNLKFHYTQTTIHVMRIQLIENIVHDAVAGKLERPYLPQPENRDNSQTTLNRFYKNIKHIKPKH